MDFVQKLISKRAKERNLIKDLGEFRTGDTVKVYTRVKEGEKERTQMYQGVVIKTQGAGFGRTFTVRKMSSGVGVERTFPYTSTKLEKVEVVTRGQVRQSRIYYLRKLKGRAARLKGEQVVPGSTKQKATKQQETTTENASAEAPKKEAKESKE